jgi:hypothetical protein
VNKIEADLVKPFYLDMMGLNALRVVDELWLSIVAAGRAVVVSEVSWMLGTGQWRPVVMGAWFSVAVPPELVRDDLLAAMSQSRGSLTAPPLAAAATVVAGPAAVPAMIAYIDFIMAPTRRDGSEDVVAAAVEHLGAESPLAPTESGRRAFHDIHGVAMRLHEDSRAH